jgi:hypothetical protein
MFCKASMDGAKKYSPPVVVTKWATAMESAENISLDVSQIDDMRHLRSPELRFALIGDVGRMTVVKSLRTPHPRLTLGHPSTLPAALALLDGRSACCKTYGANITLGFSGAQLKAKLFSP